MKVKDYCSSCPFFYQAQDYWGEWNEECLYKPSILYKKPKFMCKAPLFIKKIYGKYMDFRDWRWEHKMMKEFEQEEMEERKEEQ